MTGSKAARTVATMFIMPAAAAIWRLDRHPAVAAVAVAAPSWFTPD
jgi:hypothetical protein